jgi:hypothetical protein
MGVKNDVHVNHGNRYVYHRCLCGFVVSKTDEFTRPDDTMRERVGETRVRLWLLITANRWSVTAVLLVSSYVFLLLLGIFGPSSIQRLLTTSGIATMFSLLIIATVTTVTLVLTISQLVLAQEIGPLGDQRERMQDAISFRKDIEETSDLGVSPSEPSVFLETLIDLVDTRAEVLNDEITDGSNEDDFSDIAAYTSGIIDHGQAVREELDDAEFGSFDILLAVLNYNYSWKIFAARQLRDDHREELSEEEDEAFIDLIESLRFFGPSREHFKTLYFQWEVVNISRSMLYGAMPALMIAGYMVMLYDPMRTSGAIFGLSKTFLFASAMYLITLIPFAILLAFLLRLLTVAKRTLAIGPFILRETEEIESVRTNEDPD